VLQAAPAAPASSSWNTPLARLPSWHSSPAKTLWCLLVWAVWTTSLSLAVGVVGLMLAAAAVLEDLGLALDIL
jgi:hypothetical protein